MGWIGEEIHYDCLHFRNDKPCRYGLNCPYCPHYHPMDYRVLIIKLGAMGDVLRTTAILPSLIKHLRPKRNNVFVTWIVDPPARPLLEHNPYLQRVWTVDLETMLRLHTETYDLALCFDKEPRAIGLMALCRAETKRGFTMGPEGNIRPVTPAAEEALWMGLSDMYKFRRNTKSYQRIIHEMAEIPDAGELYVLHFTPAEITAAEERLQGLGARRRPLIGLNTGAGDVFPGKRWSADKFAELARRLHDQTAGTIVLLGGPQEVERNNAIAATLGGDCVDLGTDNPLRLFTAMVSRLNLLVAGDTMALHVGLASGVPTVALFGPTPQQEVDMGAGSEKLWREPFGPGIMSQPDESSSVIQEISVAEVEAACLRRLRK